MACNCGFSFSVLKKDNSHQSPKRKCKDTVKVLYKHHHNYSFYNYGSQSDLSDLHLRVLNSAWDQALLHRSTKLTVSHWTRVKKKISTYFCKLVFFTGFRWCSSKIFTSAEGTKLSAGLMITTVLKKTSRHEPSYTTPIKDAHPPVTTCLS